MGMTFADVLRAEDAEMPRAEKWDRRWMRIAEDIAGFSKDPGHKVGAVMVDSDLQIITSTGYNGFPRSLADNRLENRDRKLSRTVHAEVNCLINAPRVGLRYHDITMYVHGLPPCEHCATVMIQSGVKRVVVNKPTESLRAQTLDGNQHELFTSPWSESGERAKLMFNEAGVKYDVLDLWM